MLDGRGDPHALTPTSRGCHLLAGYMGEQQEVELDTRLWRISATPWMPHASLMGSAPVSNCKTPSEPRVTPVRGPALRKARRCGVS